MVPHVSGKDLRIHPCPCVCASVRVSVRNHFSPKPHYKCFCLLAWSCTFRKLKMWRFSAKNAHFGLFLPNATINVPHFGHRNIFFGLLKNGAKKFRGKILKIDFLAVFGPFWAKYAHFGPFLQNATINVPHFHNRNIFFGLLQNGAKYFLGKILKFDFLGIFLIKIAQNLNFFNTLT